MEMLADIKTGIQTHTPVTELATSQITRTMMETVEKGSAAKSLMPQITLEQFAEGYSAYTGASLELGGQFSDLIKNFIINFVGIAQKQGLTDSGIVEIIDQ